MTVLKCIIDMMQTRTIEAQIVQKLKNNEARPEFTGSHNKKKRAKNGNGCTGDVGFKVSTIKYTRCNESITRCNIMYKIAILSSKKQ